MKIYIINIKKNKQKTNKKQNKLSKFHQIKLIKLNNQMKVSNKFNRILLIWKKIYKF